MEKKMETTIVYWGYIGIMEKEMEAPIYVVSDSSELRRIPQRGFRIKHQGSSFGTDLCEVKGLTLRPCR